MKKILMLMMIASTALLPFAGGAAWAGEVDVLVAKLVQKGILTPSEAQIVMDETKVQVSKDLAQAKSISVPEWTQRIKWGGDVRYRTQGDWGKKSATAGDSMLLNQEWRNRVRGRFYMEGKVNDFTYAGVRFAGGALKANSTNDTLQNYWNKAYAMFDQYYIRLEAPRQIVRDYGRYFSDLKFWAGRFPIPFEYSELVWDSDINPSGVALQYTSPDLKLGDLPAINLYDNCAMLWLDESAQTNVDPILWVMQGGVKTDEFGPLGSTLNFSGAIYNFANIKDKAYTGGQYTNPAGTNTRWTTDEVGTGSPLLGRWRYGFQVLDLLFQLDNKRIGDFEFPHGFFANYIYNFACIDDTTNKGFAIGGYIGKKKIKEPGDWKARAEARYIERNAIPDFMPDSDFYGFGRFDSTTMGMNAGNNGLPFEGGTNGKGVNWGIEYQLFKNTALNFEFYWMKPIKSWGKTDPWTELQMDVVTKF